MPEKVSTRGSGAKKGAPKYQNKFAYSHNKGSKKTQKILSLPIDGLCRRCTDQIEWRKQYRKYKPLTVPKKCVGCQLKKVKKAYHVLCDDCAASKGVCAKCQENAHIVENTSKTSQDVAEEEQLVRQKLAGLRERERRSYLRKMERGEIAASELPDAADSDFSDSDQSQDEE
ncbi:hypothetical protein IWW36_004239 [Coemansia brasiliensis]|uniref:Uncharacterized protein n=1 Tax=Coemansia brasiliensis TaxID=2650707 RepID=A0A9W8ICI8_9FUNG|nr:hypothetical protein IWW36_004239 [Coemansia brasiliensis]